MNIVRRVLLTENKGRTKYKNILSDITSYSVQASYSFGDHTLSGLESGVSMFPANYSVAYTLAMKAEKPVSLTVDMFSSAELSETVSGTKDEKTVTSSSDLSATLAAGDVLMIYSPYQSIYLPYKITGVSGTTINISKPLLETFTDVDCFYYDLSSKVATTISGSSLFLDFVAFDSITVANLTDKDNLVQFGVIGVQ